MGSKFYQPQTEKAVSGLGLLVTSSAPVGAGFRRRLSSLSAESS